MSITFGFKSNLHWYIDIIVALEWYLILIFILVPPIHNIFVDIIVTIAITT